VAIGSLSAGSTCDSPYKQPPIGLGAGAGSMFRIGGGRHVLVMWHREGDLLVLTWWAFHSMGLPVPLPVLLSLIEIPHILFGQGGGIVWVGVGMVVPRQRLLLSVVKILKMKEYS
jgi:hypothetical protein